MIARQNSFSAKSYYRDARVFCASCLAGGGNKRTVKRFFLGTKIQSKKIEDGKATYIAAHTEALRFLAIQAELSFKGVLQYLRNIRKGVPAGRFLDAQPT